MNQPSDRTYIYLHGFASSPQSAKATYLHDRFSEVGIPLITPDLNYGDFSHLTLTRQLQQVTAEFPPAPAAVTLIGSSFGGLTATWLAQNYPQVKQLILLAPAFNFLNHWIPALGAEKVQQWQQDGYLPVYHYGEKREVPLHYNFILDAQEYREELLQRNLPTLILHGNRDRVIPIQASLDFAKTRPWVKAIALDSDHALANVMADIWQEIKAVCELS